MQRLDKALSDMGLGTRSEVRRLVRDGRVKVGGLTIKDPAFKVNETNEKLEVNGEEIYYQRYVYLMLNKPVGFLSATRDTKTSTVLDLLPRRYKAMELFSAGRLDIDSVGFLLLTNDGAFAHFITSPRRHVDKVYFVRVIGNLDERDVQAFSEGVALEDGQKCLPAGLIILSAGEVSEAEVTIKEGKFHQVKRMFLSVGKRVTYLKRVSIGGVCLDKQLKEGEYRPLTEEELNILKNNANLLQ